MSPGLDELESRKAEVVRLCRRFNVRRLWVFGSAVKGTWKPGTSDFDLSVEFGPRPPGMRAIEQFFGHQRELEALLGRKVDIVEWSAAKNPFFRREVERHRKELYAA